MMLGIRTTVGQTESKPLKEKLSGSDMRREVKLRFPHGIISYTLVLYYAYLMQAFVILWAGGSSSTPAHEMRDFKFKDYAPDVCRSSANSFISTHYHLYPPIISECHRSMYVCVMCDWCVGVSCDPNSIQYRCGRLFDVFM
jgi:hypothetical protein